MPARAIELNPISIAGSAMSVIDQIREPDQRTAFLAATHPFLESIQTIHTGMLDILDKNGVTERQVLTYLDKPMTPRDLLSVSGKKEFKLATQYEHVKKVLRTTLALKKNFIENNLPERIVGYQTGTGWPLPEENENCKQVGFIRYGTEELSGFSPAGSDTDKKAGMYIYRVKGKDGNEITLLALKGRYHAYTETDTPLVPHHDLAFMPRVLKGLGTEFVLSTFASGADKLAKDADKIKKHDLGVVIAASDESGISAQFGPGTGDTRIISQVFGGAFQNIGAMIPEVADVKMLMDTVREVNENESAENAIKPQVVPAVQVDTRRTPDFQSPYDQAAPHVVFDRILQNKTLPPHLLKLFPNLPVALVHGMVQMEERNTYFQSWDKGIASPFNRRLRELAVETFTDMLDLSPEGQSHVISDDEVRRSAKEAEAVMAKIITGFFERYADTPQA